jgi:RNA-directed DNA polymerase
MSPEEARLLAQLASAARDCARRKRGRPEAIAFRMREGEALLALAEELREGRYAPSPFRVFVTEKPKLREIHVAAYRDRVVHHLLHALLEPLWEARFLPCSFACRKGRGTHAAARALGQILWNETRHGQRRAYALSLDVRSFFPSIDKALLLERLRPTLRGLPPLGGAGGMEVEALARAIVMQDAAASARPLAPRAALARVPPHKRLGAMGPERGIPIGNLTSQFFANVYLHSLDLFVTRGLGARGYVRYADDMVLVHHDADALLAWEARIRAFLDERLRLSLHPAPPPRPVSQGVDFVGYIVRPRYVLPRRRVVVACREKLRAVASTRARKVGAGERLRLPGTKLEVAGPARVLAVDHALAERLRATWASYQGHLAHAQAHRLRVKLWAEAGEARLLLAEGGTRVRFATPGALYPSLAAQRRALARGLGDALLLMQVGCELEVPPHRAAEAGLRVGLRRTCRGRRRRVASVPMGAASRHIRRLLDEGRPLALALEAPCAAGEVKARELRWLLLPEPSQADTTALEASARTRARTSAPMERGERR